jgi:hypothetical protein
MIRFFTKNIYLVLSSLLIISSIFGGTYLVKQTQDTRRRAEELPEYCSPLEKELCQENTQGNNTGFICICTPWSQYEKDFGYWDCDTRDLTKCPTDSGETDPTIFTCTEANAKIEGRCLKAISGTLSLVNHYKCPNVFDTSGGCQDNRQTYENVTQVCFDSNFCGIQQIDYTANCFMSTIDENCTTPTPVKLPTSTPTPTKKPTSTLTPTTKPTNTPTIKPTSTPTPTKIISNTPTSTPNPSFTLTPTTKPTNTPTPTTKPTSTPTPTPTTIIISSTPVPTNTLVPTQVIAQGPSPTRIVLPEAGVDFPAKSLSIVGIIVTLLGFLILL